MMKLGIAGLPNVGKTSLFNILSEGKGQVAGYPFTTIERNVGVCSVKDERFDHLVEVIKPKISTEAQIDIVDVAGLVEGASQGEGLGNQFLANIRDVNLIIHLLRMFKDKTVSHPYTGIDAQRDYDIIRSEFLLSDLEIVTRRIKKLEKKKKDKEYNFLIKVLKVLEEGKSPHFDPVLRDFGLLSIKPEIKVINVDEVKRKTESDCYALSIKLEEEMIEMPEGDKRSFRREYGLEPGGPIGIIEKAIKELDMIFFYTIKGDESRSWIVPSGIKAIEAAGMIHSDIEKGFIKAEVARVEDIVTMGGFKLVQDAGKVRFEGKDYQIEDGDVLLIRFQP